MKAKRSSPQSLPSAVTQKHNGSFIVKDRLYFNTFHFCKDSHSKKIMCKEYFMEDSILGQGVQLSLI